MLAAAALWLQVAPSSVAVQCRWEEKSGDSITVHFGPERDCGKWQAPTPHAGVWLYQFEGSAFVPNVRTVTEAERAPSNPARSTWFSFDDKSGFSARCRPVLGHAYRVSFIGRDAVARQHPGFFGGFGHLGTWSAEVLVDRIDSIVDLGELPGRQVRPAGVSPTCVPLKSDNQH